MTIELTILKNPLYGSRDRVSSPSRSHFSPGLKLILQTQVTNPEIMRFQSFSIGVYASDRHQGVACNHRFARPNNVRFAAADTVHNLLQSSHRYGKATLGVKIRLEVSVVHCVQGLFMDTLDSEYCDRHRCSRITQTHIPQTCLRLSLSISYSYFQFVDCIWDTRFQPGYH